MPKLDFLTLYIVILLNSLTVCIIWTAIAFSYRKFRPARIWLLSTTLLLVGGFVLSLQGNEGAFWPAVTGNTIIIYGFCLAWVGARYFYGHKGGWRLAMGISLASFAVMAAFHSSWQGRNIAYAVGQSVPMGMTVFYLARQKGIGLGGQIAILAFLLGIIGHAIETSLNIAAWVGEFDQSLYFTIESYALVCVIYSGMIWNFGFIVMAINDAPLAFNGQKLAMTVSIGIASEERDNETSDLDVFARADLALYKVKQAGRNGYATRTATVNAPHSSFSDWQRAAG
ncbi:diguanylate cyclase [Brucella anthropi]|uniref:GGDEF domain-containing protein n=1 Tax=Brucella anthropi TaxID=529 RepID=UPI0026715F71|nr:diguanylate cyclase [Brucella anthropi]WKT93264.1 diguanylate cyclase [Brucella anthropi]